MKWKIIITKSRRGHPFSTYATFSENLTVLSHVRQRVCSLLKKLSQDSYPLKHEKTPQRPPYQTEMFQPFFACFFAIL